MRKRTEIVSPELCDDVLSYIGPTLQKHRNCDILDLNPGIGVWSSKIHEYLKPRTHILLEPQAAAYQNYLDPLLDQEGSTYKLVEKHPHYYTTYEELVNEGYFPHQTKYDDDDPRSAEQNNTLLVTGCLTVSPRKYSQRTHSKDRHTLHSLLFNAWDQRLVHAYGKVRILVWTQNIDEAGFLTKSISHKGTDPLVVRKLFNVRQVVAPRPGARGIGVSFRDPRYNLQSAARVVQSMRELGLSIPPHRQSVLHKLATEIVDKGIENGDLGNDGAIQFVEEAAHRGMSTEGLLGEQHRDKVFGDIALAKDPSLQYTLKTTKKGIKAKLTNWGRMHGYNTSHAVGASRNRQNRCKRVDMGMEIYRLECELTKTQDEAEKQKLQAKLSSLNEEFKEAVEDLVPSQRAQIPLELDDRLALNSSIPPLDWDRRKFEPLEHRPDEVWPAGKVSLLDFEPNIVPHGEKLPGDFMDYVKFLKGLQTRYKNSVLQALEIVDPGASELVKSVPELFDPTKGGRLDLNNLRARLLTVEMVDALYKAYMEWPFRSSDLATIDGRNKRRT
ncbi:S-adenosyl-L-methionine-dependent methyltransferase [Mytilinidion resinicola]|uniref:Mitochondrial transcription factor 1 n=1 Tax=Mytilinidion resinicola TaxID=574789 RepID=A0A6A6Z1U6_9PEZI|nr:S-adenosyl-L-methionine-dependent methyltransferase [Mytilinidion resinicola]KAF2815142.1 S-adenosyl-L-methionine-dependent methyltransferase [Mytilinidion resinicola]